MSTLRRIIGEGIVKSLEAATTSSAGSQNQQAENREVAGEVVKRYCGLMSTNLNNPEIYEDENKRALLRNIDRTIVGLAHLRDQVDPPSIPNVLPRHQDMFSVQENIRLASDANDRRHDQIVEQQFTYLTDFMLAREQHKKKIEAEEE